MIDSLMNVARCGIGIKLAYECLSPDTLDGKEHPDPQYQKFIDTLTKTTQTTQKIFVREVDWGESMAAAASTLCAWTGLSQIFISKSNFFPKDEVKVILAHELGHIAGRHPVIVKVFLASNAALLAIPLISLPTVLTTWTFSAISLIPLFMWAEKEADAFALQHCPVEVLKASQITEDARASTRQPQTGWKADLLKFFVFRSKERRHALEERIHELSMEK